MTALRIIAIAIIIITLIIVGTLIVVGIQNDTLNTNENGSTGIVTTTPNGIIYTTNNCVNTITNTVY